MELKNLVGKYKLSGVDLIEEKMKEEYGEGFEDCQIVRFRLDGKVYTVIEDPEDGYRSSMREIVLLKGKKMVNYFSPVAVVGHYVNARGCESCDILELISITSGKVILEIGTDNTGDYYPSFVGNFSPENIR